MKEFDAQNGQFTNLLDPCEIIIVLTIELYAILSIFGVPFGLHTTIKLKVEVLSWIQKWR